MIQVQSPFVRHVLPAAVAAGAAVFVSKYGPSIGRAYATGLRALPSAGLGVIAGIFYSATFDLLSAKTNLHPIIKHSFSILTSAVVTTGAAFAAASLGWIALPSFTALGVMIGSAILCDILFRAIFAGRAASPVPKPPEVIRDPVPPKVPNPNRPVNPVSPPMKLQKVEIEQGKPKTEVYKPWSAQAAANPGAWSWPADLSKIGISHASKNQIDDFLNEVMPQVAAGNIPAFLKKGDSYLVKKGENVSFNGKNWIMPRTLYFAVVPGTQQLSAVLLNVSKKRVPILGKGGQRTVKVCCNLTTGERVVKKAACGAYEVELLKTLNGTKGFEHLSQVRVTTDRTGQTKARLITPLFDGSVDKLISSAPNLTAKDIKNLMISFFSGLEKLHNVKGRTSFPDGKRYKVNYNSYHLDISPHNLLYVKKPDGSYEGAVTDAGTVNDLPHLWHKQGWHSPEKYKLIYRFGATDGEKAAYLAKYGQHDDIWNMGLVLSCLLKGSNSHVLSLKDHGALTQKDVDAEIARQKPRAASFTVNRNAKATLWDVARQLLQVTPEQRLTAKQAREALEKVVA